MFKINDEIIGIVEKLTNQGEGIIRFGEDKFVVFVKNVLPNEKVKVKIVSKNKHFAKGEVVEILEQSSHRVKPFCALYNACGSCDMQIADYDYLLEQKTAILKEIFENLCPVKDTIMSPVTKEYRHKIQFPVSQTKNSKRILMGYYKNNSHDLTNIKFCPIQPAIINDIAEFIRKNWDKTCYNENKNEGLLKNVLFRINTALDSILLTLIVNLKKKDCSKNDYKDFFNKIMLAFPQIKGCFLNFNTDKTNTILGKHTIKILGDDYLIETLEDKKYAIGPVSFFQINTKSAINLFNIVKENVKPNSTLLDAYGGVGAIGIFCSDKAKKITLVEENANAIEMAKKNFELNKIENYKILSGDAKKHFIDFKDEKKTFDYIILDPPRSGCDKEGLEVLADLAKNIIYVSCNPQTLKRDVKCLAEFGFKPKFVQGVDLFPYTHHIESVCILEKL